MSDLAQVLADWRGEAAILRKRGDSRVAECLEQCAAEAAAAAEEYLLFLEEDEAMLRDGRGRDWHRARYAAWERDGHAYQRNGRRYYRAIMLPRRVHRDLAVAEAKRLMQRKAS